MKLDALIEAILFSSSEPVPVSKLAQTLEVRPEQVEEAVAVLDKLYADMGIFIQRGAGGLRIATRPECGEIISQAFTRKIPVALSKGALETLAVVAYCQPVTKGHSIDQGRKPRCKFGDPVRKRACKRSRAQKHNRQAQTLWNHRGVSQKNFTQLPV